MWRNDFAILQVGNFDQPGLFSHILGAQSLLKRIYARRIIAKSYSYKLIQVVLLVTINTIAITEQHLQTQATWLIFTIPKNKKVYLLIELVTQM